MSEPWTSSQHEFLARLRHDLRTPLNQIIGYSEMLQEDASDKDRKDMLPDLQRIHTAARNLLDVIQKNLTPSQMEGVTDRSPSKIYALTHGASSAMLEKERERALQSAAAHGHLLLVDDDAANRDMFSRRLEKQGYTISVAGDGREALAKLHHGRFDLVLLDILMPEMNGFETLQAMKSDAHLRHIPVIMISALDEMENVIRCIEAGAEDYLSKPFDPVLLRARIGACLEKKQLRDQERETLRQLEIEQQKSERLLLNILPKPIAERLKAHEKTIADDFAGVTVLFADIAGFTQISTRMSAGELVGMLNKIFTVFDRLTTERGLEKIKTIGDNYMVVGGLPIPREDHAEVVVGLAIEMRKAIADFRLADGQPLTMRIGINSGPVVAGVIGASKFIYDLWGDTVNVASRMESNAPVGGILVTAATYELLRHKFAFEAPGNIQVKGKGEMSAYVLREGRGDRG